MRKCGPTPQEQLAFNVVEHELGVTLDLTRELTAPNQVDAVLLTSEGTGFAALEVTTLCDRDKAESDRLLGKDKHRWHFPGLRWWWSVEISASARLNEAKAQLPLALRLFEAHDINHPQRNPIGPPPSDPAVKWFAGNCISAHGYANVSTDGSSRVRAPGSVMVLPPAIGGFSGSVEEVPRWISDELASSALLRSKLAKLQRSGFEEQHLFLFVDTSGAPFSVYDHLTSLAVPTDAPELETITHLWLFPSYPFSRTVLRWSGQGWRRCPVPEPAGAGDGEMGEGAVHD